MKKIIISLVALSAISGAALADYRKETASRNSDYNQAFFVGKGAVRHDSDEGSRALHVVHVKKMTSDKGLNLKTNYHGEYIN